MRNTPWSHQFLRDWWSMDAFVRVSLLMPCTIRNPYAETCIRVSVCVCVCWGGRGGGGLYTDHCPVKMAAARFNIVPFLKAAWLALLVRNQD